MFWKRCGVSVNGAMPTHCAPSPPMWVTPMMPRSMPIAMPWQPMPAAATLPSGTTVERLCGQPEQKNAVRASVSVLRPALELVEVLDARLHGLDP